MFLSGNDTIAAIATGMTDAGIGIIRVSGDHAIDAVNDIFVPKNKSKSLKDMDSYSAAYGMIVDGDEIIDEVVVLLMRAPFTYTKEDVVEIDCHGGMVVLKRVLELLMTKDDVRIAEPGEFTKRAFLNGRIDLTQAESIMQLIHAKNEYSAKASVKQIGGNLSDRIKKVREEILYEIAYIESALDDPEHYSLDGFDEECKSKIVKIIDEIDEMVKSSDNGKLLSEGIQTVILGKPNAGKSSLLNAMMGEERAIVTDIEGTTRDMISESIMIEGIPLTIMDTAGIRQTEDVVEKIGVDRAKDLIEESDLILYVVDQSRELDDNDYDIIEMIKDKKAIILLNKNDLAKQFDEKKIKDRIEKPMVSISAKNAEGIKELAEHIKNLFFNGELTFNDEVYITNVRQKNAFHDAKSSLEMVIRSIDDQMPEDFLSIDLMAAYTYLGLIIGEEVEDDLVNKIFKEFCMGK